MHPPSMVAEVSRKKLGVLRHPGILLPTGMVAHNTPQSGEHISTVEEFADGEDVTIDFIVPESRIAAVLEAVSTAMATPSAYNLLDNNCEVFANRMLARDPISPQVRFVVGLIAVAGLLALASPSR